MPAWLRRRTPAPLKRLATRALELADPLVLARLRRRGEVAGAVPPRRLRARVGEPPARSYVDSGKRAAREIEAVLAAAGRPLGGVDSYWDLGAGAGRILLNLDLAETTATSASDVDEEACRWLAANGGIDARPCSATPPTTFASGSFDLITAISVFTHIDEPDQDLWLDEIHRLLRADGIALVTVMGPRLLEAYRLGRRPGATSEQIAALGGGSLDADGLKFAPERLNRWSSWRSPGTAASYGVTFHSAAYIRRRWSRQLRVLDVREGAVNWGQDAVLLAQA